MLSWKKTGVDDPVSNIFQPKLHRGENTLVTHFKGHGNLAHPLEEQDFGGFAIPHGDVEM